MSEDYVRLAVISTARGQSFNDKVTHETSLKLDSKISDVKFRLMMIVGTDSQFQELQLMDDTGTVLADMKDDNSLLKSYNPQAGQIVNVIDVDPNQEAAGLEDTSQVKKYVMDDDNYDKKEGTYRAWRKENPDFKLPHQALGPSGGAYDQAPEGVNVGTRCQLKASDGGESYRRGTVRFIGFTTFSTGVWIGVELDEPTGKNDGSVKGTRYFECTHKHGSFVRADKLDFGDYPPMDELDDELDEM